MKKLLVFLVIILAISVLTACMPDPPDVAAYCKELYVSDFPDYPEAFIGFCVATLQSGGNAKSAISLCSYEPFLVEIGVETRQECIQLIFDQ